MKKKSTYYKFKNAYSSSPGGYKYYEITDPYVTKSITLLNDEIIEPSNIIIPPWSLLLPEGKFNQAKVDELVQDHKLDPIKKREFFQIWNTHLEQHKEQWEKTKKKFPINTLIKGYFLRFSTKEAIVNLGNNIVAVADYHQCLKSTNNQLNMSAYNIIFADIQGYDEEYQWIVLKNPKVKSPRIDRNTHERLIANKEAGRFGKVFKSD